MGYELTEAALSFRAFRDAHVAAMSGAPPTALDRIEVGARSIAIAEEALAVADQLRAKLGLPPATALNDGYVRETIESAIAAANTEPESEVEDDDWPADATAHPNARS